MVEEGEVRDKWGLGFAPPKYWDKRYVRNLEKLPKPIYKIKKEEDVYIPTRDGDKICVDVYRPDAEGKFPALLAFSAYGKSSQGVKVPPQGWDSHVFDHCVEAGDIEFFVTRGFAFVIADPHGIGKSEGEWYGPYSKKEQEDCYDVIEWIAKQPWCNGNVGMIGISYFGIIQLLAAAQQPPHLKAIMPIECTDDWYLHAYPGGILYTFYYDLESNIAMNNPVPESFKLYTEEEIKEKIKELLRNTDIKNNSYLVRVLTTWPPKNHPVFFDALLHPLDGPFWRERSAYPKYDKIKVPVYLCDPWRQPRRYIQGLWRAFMDPKLNVPKKAMVFETWEMTRLPYRIANPEILVWYSHWLLGIDTWIMEEPPIKIFVSGVNKYRYEHEFPLARTKWTKFYLKRFGGLATEPEEDEDLPPDSFVHVPPTVTNEIQSLNYLTEPFVEPLEITGPIVLYIYVSIDAEDGNLIVKLWDVDSDGKRVGLPISQGSIRLSHRVLVKEKSKPWWPVYDHTKALPLEPNKIYEYAIECIVTSHVFLPGHRLELEIKAMDPQPVRHWNKITFLGPLPSYKVINYKIYRDKNHPSHLLLPVIPETPDELWVQPLE